jgi:hypothetical protein
LRSLDRDLESVSAGIDGFAIAGAGPGPGTARQRPVLASRPRDAHTEPSLPAMLRAEYDLPPEAIKEIQQNIESIARKYRASDYD